MKSLTTPLIEVDRDDKQATTIHFCHLIFIKYYLYLARKRKEIAMYPNCNNLSYNEIFALNVKARREAMGLTRKELAENQLGYPEELLARVESGDTTGCTIDFLVCLSEDLEVPLETLMTGRYFCPLCEKTGRNPIKVTVRVKKQPPTPTKNTTPRPIVRVIRVHTNWPMFPAHWQPLRAYPMEYICSKCGELCPDEKTHFCSNCGARIK